MNNKKGISAIVATVLIILITVAAVTIIWAAIIPMVSNQLDKGSACLDAVSDLTIGGSGYSCVETTGIVNVQVKLGGKGTILDDIRIIVDDDTGNTILSTLLNAASPNGLGLTLPGPNSARLVTTGALTNPQSVSIAPIITIGNAQETCDTAATFTLPACG